MKSYTISQGCSGTPGIIALHGLSEGRIYGYITRLRAASELVRTDPMLITPVRDLNDTMAMQTAITGDTEVLCKKDQDFL